MNAANRAFRRGEEEKVKEALGIPLHKPSEVMMVGDSQIATQRRALKKEGFRSIAKSGETIGMSMRRVKAAFKKNPKLFDGIKIINIHAGGNDVWYASLDKDRRVGRRVKLSMKNQIRAYVKFLSEVAPDVMVVVSTITPRESRIKGKSSAREKEIRDRLVAYNDWVRNGLPGEFSNVKCFDAYSVLEDPNKPGYQNQALRSKDRLHFSQKSGYPVYRDAFRRQFGVGVARAEKEKAIDGPLYKVDRYGRFIFKKKMANWADIFRENAVTVNGRLAVKKGDDFYYPRKWGSPKLRKKVKIKSGYVVNTYLSPEQKDRVRKVRTVNGLV